MIRNSNEAAGRQISFHVWHSSMNLVMYMKLPISKLYHNGNNRLLSSRVFFRGLCSTFCSEGGQKFYLALKRRRLRSCHGQAVSLSSPFAHACPSTRENLSSGFASNKGANQPTHMRRLISAFVIRFLETCYKRNFNFLASPCD